MDPIPQFAFSAEAFHVRHLWGFSQFPKTEKRIVPLYGFLTADIQRQS